MEGNKNNLEESSNSSSSSSSSSSYSSDSQEASSVNSFKNPNENNDADIRTHKPGYKSSLVDLA